MKNNLSRFYVVSIIVILLYIVLFSGCKKDDPWVCGDLITDVDGNSYQTVQIGDQCWMAENLKSTKFSNGDGITQVVDGNTWGTMTSAAWCYYNNDANYNAVYGKLYNGYAMEEVRNVCPDGWHVPTEADWTVLTDHLGGNMIAGGKMKSTGTEYWTSPNSEATNSSGFSGDPGGLRGLDGISLYEGVEGRFWGSTPGGFGGLAGIVLEAGNGKALRTSGDRKLGQSCRCLMD